MGLAVCAFCFAASYTIVPVLFGARDGGAGASDDSRLLHQFDEHSAMCIISRRLEFRRLSLLDMTITLGRHGWQRSRWRCGLNGAAMVLGVVAASIAGYHPHLLLGSAPAPELPPSLRA